MDSRKSGLSHRQLTLAIVAFVVTLLVAFRAVVQYRDVVFLDLEECCQPKEQESSWGGWSSVENIFVFGDSWSDTYFNVLGEQPSPENPMGNIGGVAEPGGKWPVHLTTVYNDSLIQTYCFARSGAFVDRTIVNENQPDFVEQMERDFLPGYVAYDFGQSAWRADKSLFIIFFGINDNRLDAEWTHSQATREEELAVYSSQLDILYSAGARNFLIMNAPPIGRSPSGTHAIARSIHLWNTRLVGLAADFRAAHTDATVHEFDTFTFFDGVMNNPARYPETTGYKNVTEFCKDYAGKDLVEDSYSENCGFSLKEYLWHDPLHPTSPVHVAMASQIAAQLRSSINETATQERLELRRGHKHRLHKEGAKGVQ